MCVLLATYVVYCICYVGLDVLLQAAEEAVDVVFSDDEQDTVNNIMPGTSCTVPPSAIVGNVQQAQQ